MNIRVLLADDHPMVLKGLRFFLNTQSEISIIGEAHNGREALDMTIEHRPDLVLLDLKMPIMDGVETTKAIKKACPDTKIIILTSFSDQEHVVPAIKAGANGYQLKEIQPDELVQVIKSVHEGKKQLHAEATNQLLSHLAAEDSQALNETGKQFATLTPRETDVLEQITMGKGNKTIAADLFITEKTVKTHVSNILGKLGVKDRTQAAILAMEHGWFTRDRDEQ